ncbi:12057_t:CDS:2, partial [Cetraspora pellucida]
MNGETFKDHQKRLQCEHQQKCRQQKRNKIDNNSNLVLASGIEQDIAVPSMNTLSQIPRAHIYSWSSHSLDRHMLGKVTLPPFQNLPTSLNNLLTGTDSHARSFQHNIRMYNSALSFTSIGANIDNQVTETSDVYTFRIYGEVYHRIDAFSFDPESQPQFAQIYIYDTDHELQNRINIMPGLDSTILADLQQMLHDINPYANVFHQVGYFLNYDPLLDLKLIITNNRTKDPHHYNTSSASEPNDENQENEPNKCVTIMNYLSYKLQIDARYVSASEALWRILHYQLHNEKPDIMQLHVHLPGQYRVLFKDDESLEDIVQRSAVEKTTLTAWFQANTIYPEARNLTYANFPSQWTYNIWAKKWKLRQREYTIGRMYFVHPAAGERYYLRMLLSIVVDSTSFEDIRTINEITYHSFREACIALNLLQEDEEWDQCLTEAKQMQSGAQLRNLFATLLIFCNPLRPETLWKKHIYSLCDDILFQTYCNTGNIALELRDTNIQNRALLHLQSILNKHGRCLEEFPYMPIPIANTNTEQDNYLIREEQQYNIEELAEIIEKELPCLNVDQRAIFDEVIATVETKTPAIFFVDGPGETGKTFLYKIEGNIIQLPKDIILPSQDINALIHFIYPNLSASSDSQYLVERAILAPKNEHVNTINAAIMTQFP